MLMSETLLYSISSSSITCGCLLSTEQLAIGTKNGDVIILNYKDKKEVQKVAFGNFPLESLQFNGTHLLSCFSDTCALMDTDGKLVQTIKFGEALKEAFVLGEHIFASTKSDCIIRRRLDTEEMSQVKAESKMYGMAICDKFLAVALGSGHITLYDPESLGVVQKFGAHSINAYCVAISGDTLVTGGGDALGTLFSIKSDLSVECIKTFGQLEWPIKACASDGHFIAFGSDGDPFVLLLETGNAERRLAVTAPIIGLFFSPVALFVLSDRGIYQFATK